MIFVIIALSEVASRSSRTITSDTFIPPLSAIYYGEPDAPHPTLCLFARLLIRPWSDSERCVTATSGESDQQRARACVDTPAHSRGRHPLQP